MYETVLKNTRSRRTAFSGGAIHEIALKKTPEAAGSFPHVGLTRAWYLDNASIQPRHGRRLGGFDHDAVLFLVAAVALDQLVNHVP